MAVTEGVSLTFEEDTKINGAVLSFVHEHFFYYHTGVLKS